MIKETEDGFSINIRIIPNSSKNCMIIEEDLIKVKVTAQPIEGKANKALIEFLSKELKIPKSKIEIVKGETSKDKVVFFSVKDRQIKDSVILRLTNS